MLNQALDRFLAGVERRAYRIALLSVKDEQAALDLVQDAMMRLAEKYPHHDPQEWPLLFQRILQNAILDHYRRQKVRRAWVSLFGDLGLGSGSGQDASEGAGPEDSILQMPSPQREEPDSMMFQQQQMTRIEAAIAALPLRQRQAFLLRYWEDMDVAETAQAMGCSEGSVKTHCSRAVKALSDSLADLGAALKD